jgi:hypothetical protein
VEDGKAAGLGPADSRGRRLSPHVLLVVAHLLGGGFLIVPINFHNNPVIPVTFFSSERANPG